MTTPPVTTPPVTIQVGRRRADDATVVLALIATTALGCAGQATATDPVGTTRVPAAVVRGRVVDAESCASTAGCQGIPDLRVAWAAAPDVVHSQPTRADGAFELRTLPRGTAADLVVLPPAAAGSADAGPPSSFAGDYAPTLNPMVVDGSEEEIFGLVVYVLSAREDSLLRAYLSETGMDLVRLGGYVGQVLRRDPTSVQALEGASVTPRPVQGEVRYVNVLPHYVMNEEPFLPSGAAGTGPFGLFVVPALGGAQSAVLFAPEASGVTLDYVVTPLRPGWVAFGLHRGDAAPATP